MKIKIIVNGKEIEAEVSDKDAEMLTEEKYSGRYEPKDGESYWYIYGNGDTSSAICGDYQFFNKGHMPMNNCFRTKHEANMHKVRLMALTTPNTAKKGGAFWVFSFIDGVIWNGAWDSWATQPKFATKEEAEAWANTEVEGIKYKDAILFFNQ